MFRSTSWFTLNNNQLLGSTLGNGWNWWQCANVCVLTLVQYWPTTNASMSGVNNGPSCRLQFSYWIWKLKKNIWDMKYLSFETCIYTIHFIVFNMTMFQTFFYPCWKPLCQVLLKIIFPYNLIKLFFYDLWGLDNVTAELVFLTPLKNDMLW